MANFNFFFFFQIPVVANLPVGRNLHDHWGGMLPFVLADNIKPFSEKLTDESQINEYIRSKKGKFMTFRIANF